MNKNGWVQVEEKKPVRLHSIRQVWACASLALFFVLLLAGDYRWMKGYNIDMFMELSPLVSIAAFMTSGTVYMGLALSGLIILITLIFGRVFCSWMCPLGILNQFTSWVFSFLRPAERYQGNAYHKSFRIKYYILAALLVLAAFGSLQVGLLDPIALLSRSVISAVFPAANMIGADIYHKAPFFLSGVLIAFILVAILLSNRFMTRYWCRVLCPLGALLGVLSSFALFRIRRDVKKCTDCKKCVLDCQGGDDPDTELRVTECHVCFNCMEQCPDGALQYGLPKVDSSVQKPIDIGRRRVVETAIAAAAFFPMMRSTVAARTVADKSVIRPPGSLEETDFLSRCIKCAACMRVCPTNVLQPAFMEAGIEGLWTPILKNQIGWCEQSCTLCGHACPTGAIQKLTVAEKVGVAPFDEPLKLGTAFYDHGRCLPWSMQTECVVCEEVCPTSPKAIWTEEREMIKRDGKKIALKLPYVEPELCIGCGICENQCPVIDHAAIRVTSVGETRSKTNRMLLK